MGNKQQQLQRNLNIMCFGADLLIQSNYMASDWSKDEKNSAEDFHLYKNTQLPPDHKFLWCPQNGIILYQTVESLMINLEFETVFYCVFYENGMGECRKMIHWLMNEDAMRQCSLTIFVLTKLELDLAQLKSTIEDELQLEKMDSKQSRELLVFQFNSLPKPFNDVIQDSIKNKQESA